MSDDKKKGPDLRAGIPLPELPEGGLLAGTCDGEAVVLVNHGGRYCALSGECTHLGAPLADGLVVDGEIRCPWHHARFSLATGEAVAAPAFEPLTRYDVVQRDGRLFVEGGDKASPVAPASVAPPRRIVIVGAGAGGYACAELLARHGFGERVTLIGNDPDAPYDRTFCSKQYLAGKSERDECLIHVEAFDGPGGPAVRREQTVVSIDPVARDVVLGDGERLAFDALVLAMGAEPEVPKLPGFDRANVHCLRTLADADALIAASAAGKRAIVVGASFIGLEVAASLTQRGVEVHVVAPDAIPLQKIVGEKVGTMIRRVHEKKRVQFHLGREARSFDGTTLVLDDASTIAADFIVVGTGVTPRTALARDAGLATAPDADGGGIVVDGRLQTSVPGIHAIGDIARYPDVHAGRDLRVEHWVHAERQGQFVARLLLRRAERFDDLPFFWSAHFDTGLRYLGHVDGIVGEEADGSIDGADFTIRYADGDGGAAFATCNRDLPALEVEAAWEAAGQRGRRDDA